MKRRDFLNITATHTSGMLILPSFLSNTSFLQNQEQNDNIIVFVQLNGGNDGLNTFIPFDDPVYYTARPKIGIQKDEIINSIEGSGFHSALKNIGSLSQKGKVSIIQNVGYPKPNRSHFRSQEIWQTAVDQDKYNDHGWLGRFLDIQCKDESTAAINIDSSNNLALSSININNITIKDLEKLKKVQSDINNTSLAFNDHLDFARKIAYASVEGIDEIKKAIRNSKHDKSIKYSNSQLSNNLNWIAQLIKGNMKTKIYYTSMGGFDTHANQLASHQRQLTTVDDAVGAFYDDIQSAGYNNTTIVLFSEFGRRLKENGSGTDHGTAGPMIIIGGNNKGKVLGGNPDLTNLDNGDLVHKVDFRSVYASLLKSKFNFDAAQIGIVQKPLENLF
jgi:uncharacterized protein (DUF1501 family)